MTRPTSSPSESVAVLKVSTMDAEYQTKTPASTAGGRVASMPLGNIVGLIVMLTMVPFFAAGELRRG